MKTSALTGDNVYELFRILLFEIEKQKWSPRYLANRERGIILDPPIGTKTYKHHYVKDSKCC